MVRRAGLLLIVFALLGGPACAPEVQVDTSGHGREDELTVLVGDGPHRQILEYAARRTGKRLIVENAGADANRRVADGTADAAYFQHIPAFEGRTAQEGIAGLAVLARVHVVPYGLYSRTHTSLDRIPHFGSVLVPAGQAPLARSLYLLQHADLLTLNREFGGTSFEDLTVTEANVVDSQRHLTITQTDPEQFPEVIGAVDAVIMNPATAQQNGFDPANPLLREPAPGNPYTNVLIGSAEHADDPRLVLLARELESPELAGYIDAAFGGSVIAANPPRIDPTVPTSPTTRPGEPAGPTPLPRP
ncbi:MetQ/NlpA family ABC transporter substrate-binding protein [Nocardia sp. NPDC024068]|uniref:MetQ/NlpA family ABC transporter substrate-binding protein n=1 Tax=Nocardia sp. NPDC024068 TaxID=3157197 RepID=UPI0033F0D735